MIYYPLSILMMCGIRDILLISTPEDKDRFQELFGDGTQLGLNISYAIQPRPEGLAQAFVIGKDFIGDEKTCLILGDNLFFGHSLPEILQEQSVLTRAASYSGTGSEIPNAMEWSILMMTVTC